MEDGKEDGDDEDDECSYGELRSQLVIVIDPQHRGCPRIKLTDAKRLNQKDENAEAIQEALDLTLVKQSAQINARSQTRGSFQKIHLQRVNRPVLHEFQEEKKQDSFIEEEEEQVVKYFGSNPSTSHVDEYSNKPAEPIEPHSSVEVILADGR
jgi:hypothetical protein